jgi:hypothetical protein
MRTAPAGLPLRRSTLPQCGRDALLPVRLSSGTPAFRRGPLLLDHEVAAFWQTAGKVRPEFRSCRGSLPRLACSTPTDWALQRCGIRRRISIQPAGWP